MTHPERRFSLASRRLPAVVRPALVPAITSLVLFGMTTGAAFALAPVPTKPDAQGTTTDVLGVERPSSRIPDRTTATPTPTPTAPAPTPSTPATAGSGAGGALDLPREEWWGGPAFYSKFPKATAAGWTKDTFFPLAVFYGKPGHASQLASIGINTYMGAEHDGSPMSSITGKGISVLAQPEWTPAEVGDDPRVVGWHVSDECDQGEGECWLGGDENARVDKQRSYASAARALNDGRFVQANYGNGVLGTWWAPNTMKQQVDLVDVSSVDKYAYTSPGVDESIAQSPRWPKGANPNSSAAYGWLQDQMESFSTPAASRPNWVFVETARPFLNEDGARVITTDQIGGAVWSSIINGASGISYFQHNNSGCGTYSLVECSADLRTGVKRINAEVTALAPVINTQSYRWDFGPGLDTSLKVKNGSAYVFAMSTGTPGSRTFTLPKGVAGSTVEVVGENRTIPVANGRFTDSFAAEYSHHVYRIALGG